MFSWLLEIFWTSEGKTKLVLLNEDEGKQAKEAKEQTRRILSDALKKKESLLVEDPKEFGQQKMEDEFCPLITTDLVKDLIRELEKVSFAKNTKPEKDIGVNAYVYSGSEDRTIYLCAPFWKKDPESRSQQRTIIHDVSHFLGYGHTVQENNDRVQKSPQSMLFPLTAYSVASVLTYDMVHLGTYRDGSYSCCGETSRDTVCEKSCMAQLRLLRKVNHLRRQISLLQRDTDKLVRTKIPLFKMETSMLKTKTSLQKEQDYELETLANMLKMLTILLTSKTNLLKTQNTLLDMQTTLSKTQTTLLITKITLMDMPTDLLTTYNTVLDIQITLLLTTLLMTKTTLLDMQTNPLKTQNTLLDMQTSLRKTQITLVITKTTLLDMQTNLSKTRTDLVKEKTDIENTRVDLKMTLTYLEKTLASIKETEANMMETWTKILDQSEIGASLKKHSGEVNAGA